MSLDKSSLPDFRAIELHTPALDVLRYSALGAGGTMVEIALFGSLLFGVLTILISTSIYFLISTGSVARTNGRILFVGTVLLYLSTTTYMAALIWAWSEGSRLLSKAADGLFSSTYNGQDGVAAFEHALYKQSWMVTIALAVNLVTGDAIVWWRACVVWQRRVVNWTGLLLLSLTTNPQTTGLTFLVQGNVYGQLAAILSLSTNVLATSLIAYKAWEHRQMMKRHFAEDMTTSRVFKALALLMESGFIYCALLIFVIIYQADPTSAQGGPGTVYATVAADFTYGCFVPLVAIYPTIIIVLVALKRSPIDTARLSRVCQHEGSGTGEGGTSSTIVFHHSTFRSVEMEGVAEGILAGDRWSRNSLETSMSKGDMKAVGDLD